METHAHATDNSIDPVLIAAIVRKVIARLTEPNPVTGNTVTGNTVTGNTGTANTVTANAGVISVKTIEQQTGKHLVVTNSAVITPAARDEAQRRGIRIERINETSVERTKLATVQTTTKTISDVNNPQRAEAIRNQLRRRGIELSTINVILSDSPASEVHRQIIGGQSAAMVTEVSDVERFQSELSPAVWVLDMKRLNIPAAVNVAAKISHLAKTSQLEGTKR